jgi:hypothetical protein
VVLLASNSNLRPANFEFTMRSALAHLHETRVFNRDEFRQLAKDRHFALDDDKLDSATIKRFSEQVAPVLVVDTIYARLGDANWHAALRVIDGRTGELLLVVDHPKLVMLDSANEVLYPMLNQLRRWYAESARQNT